LQVVRIARAGLQALLGRGKGRMDHVFQPRKAAPRPTRGGRRLAQPTVGLGSPDFQLRCFRWERNRPALRSCCSIRACGTGPAPTVT
jgi:hypothetical protein